MKVFRIALLAVFYLCITFLPASAAIDNISVSIHYWPQVHTGMGQSYNIRVTGDDHGVYVVLSLHPDTDIYAINHTEGVQCAEFQDDGTILMCYASDVTESVTVSAHGTVIGPGGTMYGRDGVYGIVRVGTLEDGSPGRGWILDAKFYDGGTIPSALAPEPEPTSYQLFIPRIAGE